jgi:hypothetical protein
MQPLLATSKNIIAAASLTIQQRYVHCRRFLQSTAMKIRLLRFLIIPQLLASCDVCIVDSSIAPSGHDVKNVVVVAHSLQYNRRNIVVIVASRDCVSRC